MIRRPPRSTRTDTLFPYTTLFRSLDYVRSNTFNGIEQTTGFSCPNSPQKKPRGTSAMLLRGVLALANHPAFGSTLFVSSFHPQEGRRMETDIGVAIIHGRTRQGRRDAHGTDRTAERRAGKGCGRT